MIRLLSKTVMVTMAPLLRGVILAGADGQGILRRARAVIRYISGDPVSS